MLTWSNPNAIVPDKPLRWILTTLRFYAIVVGMGIALAFVGISILALASRVLHHNVNPIETSENNRIDGSNNSHPQALPHKGVDVPPMRTGVIDRIEGNGGTVMVLIAMIILFAAATYFLGSLYGRAGYIACGVGFLVIYVGLEYFGGIGLFG
jgi:hypothetical protein